LVKNETIYKQFSRIWSRYINRFSNIKK
jgi:hypothetical protein